MPRVGPGRLGGQRSADGGWATMDGLTGRAVLLVLCVTMGTELTLAADMGTQPHSDHAENPKLRTTWNATFNTTGKVTAECGKYYASFFLQQFLKTEEELSRQCNDTTSISIAKVARVRIYQHQGSSVSRFQGRGEMTNRPACLSDSRILLSTFLKFDGETQTSMMKCVNILNNTLQNVSSLANVSVIAAENGCGNATIATDALSWDANGCEWTCQEHWTLVGQSSHCESNVSSTGMCRNSACDALSYCISLNESAPNCTHIADCMEPLQCANIKLFEGCPGWTSKMETFLRCCNESMSSDRSTVCSTKTTTKGPSPTVPSMVITSTDKLTTTASNMDWHVNISGTEGITYIHGRPMLELYEGETKNITITTWVQTTTSVCGGDNCTLYMQLSFDTNDTINCNSTGEPIEQIVVGPPVFSSDEQNADNYCKLLLYGYTIPAPTETMPLKVIFPLRGTSDFAYDQTTVKLTVTLTRKMGNETTVKIVTSILDIIVMDRNKKSTCQSINDPHLTTFDGRAYDNLYHGEYILYRHKSLPYQVNVVYQSCSSVVNASCNCAVAIKSGDDVMIFNRCLLEKKPFLDLNGTLVTQEKPVLTIDLYLNGELTPGTKIFKVDQGLKYVVYLPSGTYIKVKTSGNLLNVWIMGSPTDWNETEGLCGSYNGNDTDDFTLLNATVLSLPEEGPPTSFIRSWNVEIYGNDSLLLGILPSDQQDYADNASICSKNASYYTPGRNRDINMCNIIEGDEVTYFFVEEAPNTDDSQRKKRKRRSVLREHRRRRYRRRVANTINTMGPTEPIVINAGYVPPRAFTGMNATAYCNHYIRGSKVGKLCAQVPNVNFDQEISSCVKDAEITNSIAWAYSAEDAMKEQCLEEIKRNKSIDSGLVDKIKNANCPNSCNNNGNCSNGACECHANFTGVDCSSNLNTPPKTWEMKDLGLCNTKINDCSRAIVYGDNFINTIDLICLLAAYSFRWPKAYLRKEGIRSNALFLNFNSVVCTIPNLQPYVIYVSNDAGISKSKPLLFIPYNGNCQHCSASNQNCGLIGNNSCIIENVCYSPMEINPQDYCQACIPTSDRRHWSTLPDCQITDAVVIAVAATVGSLVGVAIGVLLYIICCRRMSRQKAIDNYSTHSGRNGFQPTLNDDHLHRSRELHPSHLPRILDSSHQDYREPYMQNYGQGVENGVDDTTYF